MTAITRKTTTGGVTIKAADQGVALIRFSTPDGKTPDKEGDVTGQAAFGEGVQVVVSPFGHRSIADGAIPAGRATIHRDGTADLQFFLDTPTGVETFRTVKGLGSIAQFSYGYRVLKEGQLTPEMRAAGAVRFLEKLHVMEVSPVVEGAGISTGTLDLKCDACAARAEPCRAEREAVAAEARRILAKSAKLLAATAESPEQLAARIRAGVEDFQAKYGYWTPPEARVDPEFHAEALSYVTWAAGRLGIVPPSVKWYGTDVPEAARARGLYYDGTHAVWLHAGLRAWQLCKTSFHETLHANRGARGLPHDEALVERETAILLAEYELEILHGRQ